MRFFLAVTILVAISNSAIAGYICGSYEYSSNLVEEVQEYLEAAGFPPGPADGAYGPKTAWAVREFQRKRNLRATGDLDEETLSAMFGNGYDFSGWSWVAGHDSAQPFFCRHLFEQRCYKYHYSPRLVRMVEQALDDAGYDPGPIDGELTEQSKEAVSAFMQNLGFTEYVPTKTGEVHEPTIIVLLGADVWDNLSPDDWRRERISGREASCALFWNRVESIDWREVLSALCMEGVVRNCGEWRNH